MTDLYNSMILVAVAAIVTLLLRLAPFIIFGGKSEMPPELKRIADHLPPAIMGVLVIYCIKGDLLNLRTAFIAGGDMAGVAATAVSLVVVTALHIWKRKTLLSIAAGTVCYMMLLRFLG